MKKAQHMKNMVLVVGKHATDRDSLTPILDLSGFETFNARTANQAWAFIEEHGSSIAAVIVDGDTTLFTECFMDRWNEVDIPMIVRQRASQVRHLPLGMRLPVVNASKFTETAHIADYILRWHQPALKLAA